MNKITEEKNFLSENIDILTTKEILEIINEEDRSPSRKSRKTSS